MSIYAPTPNIKAITVSDAGSITAPTAGQTINSIQASGLAQAGKWRLRAWFSYTGPVGAAEQRAAGNIVLFVGGTQIGTQSNGYVSMPATAGIMVGPMEWVIQLDGNTSISVATGVAGTAGVTYWSMLTADYLGT